jgi:glycosyltransferase involved in cell wall biosynthesis
MRLLAISYMLPPALYPQAIQIGRILARLPAEIGAVSGAASLMAGGLDSDPEFDRRLAFRLEIPFRPALSGSALAIAKRFLPLYAAIPDEFRFWVAKAEAAVTTKLDESDFLPDLVASFGEPMSDHLLGLRLKRRYGLPWVAHFSDPWADSVFRRGQFLANAVNRRLEAQVIATADRIIFTSQETLDLVLRRYPDDLRYKMNVIPHGFDSKLYISPSAKPERIVVRYLGSLFGRRNPLPLFRALKTILEQEPALVAGVGFELIGPVSSWIARRPAYRALPQGLVRIVDTVPYRESLRLMAGADLLLVIDMPDEVSVFLPSKLIDYLGASVPIMGIVPPGASAALLKRLDAVIADPRKPSEIVAGLRRALAEARQRRRASEPAPWGDPAIRAEYRIERTAAAFAEILRETVAAVAGGRIPPHMI